MAAEQSANRCTKGELQSAADFEGIFEESDHTKENYVASIKESNRRLLHEDSVGFLPLEISHPKAVHFYVQHT